MLAGCSSTSDNSNIPAPTANILESGGDTNQIDCTQMPWKESQKLCGPGHQETAR